MEVASLKAATRKVEGQMANKGTEEESTKGGVVWTQLATRIPKALHRTLKMYCVQADESVMEFVVAAIEEKLAAATKGKKAKK
jgi:predicted HicB family RNase H-like nuclease